MTTTNLKYVQAQTFTLSGGGVSIGNTSIVLDSFNQIDGTALTMSNFGIIGYGTLEPGSGVNEEQISFSGVTVNVDGTSTLTGVKTVLDIFPYTETSGLASDHAGGTSFVVSNTAGFYGNFANKLNDETITGKWFVIDPTQPTQIANKEYVDNIAIAGAPNATTILQGLVQLATQAQYDAKTLTGSTTAKLVATPDLNRATKYNDYVVDTGTANVYAIAPSPVISAYVAGQQFTWKVTHTNTTSSTLAVNGLSAIPIVKNISTPLTGGELVINSIVSVIYDGTNFQINSTTSPSSLSSFTNGISTRADTAASGNQVITHGLGTIPKKVTINCTYGHSGSGSVPAVSMGTYNGSTTATVFTAFNGKSSGNDSGNIINMFQNTAGSGGSQTAIITVDTTNITLAWTLTGGFGAADGTLMNFNWEAQG